MYGYIRAYKPELKFREYDTYHGYYCGLCGALHEQYGAPARWTLNYDMTFLILLLTGLYEPEEQNQMCRCVAHPLKKQMHLHSSITEYAADMSVLLYHEKCADDWADEKKWSRRMAGAVLHRSKQNVQKKYPEKSKAVMSYLQQLHNIEAQNESNPDLPAGCFGRLLGELFVWKHDEWETTLRQMGFYMGKFVYLMDAYDDILQDQKKGCYNPFSKLYETDPNFEQTCEQLLQMMMAECAKQFERLPIIQHVDILRNILYAGVWTEFYRIKQERASQKEK